MTIETNSSPIIDDEVWPPGFRFHPTDEELILYYLKRKMCRRKLKLDVIADIDVYKNEPEELPGLSLLKKGDQQWFFFSLRDRKYPNGSRSNRATRHGYWKATGKDRRITCNSRNVGVKKTLVFYRGRAPSGMRTDWVMHEYTLDEDELKRCQNVQDHYAIYKVFKKSGPGPKNGEQYGAPFREEDWVDDDCLAITCKNDQADHTQEVNNVLADDSCRNEEVSPFDGTDDIMNCTTVEPAPLELNVYDFEQALSQFVGEEETGSTMVSTSVGETTYIEPCTAYDVSPQYSSLEARCNDIDTVASGAQMWNVPEVTSTNTCDLSPLLPENDFLEMNDLLGHQPGQGTHDRLPQPVIDDGLQQKSQLRQDDAWNDSDLYFDAVAFFNNLGPNSDELPPNPCQKFRDDGFVNQGGFQGQAYVNQGGFQGQAYVNQGDFQGQAYVDNVSAFVEEIWNYEPSGLPTASSLNQETVSSLTTGDVNAGGVSASIGSELKQNQNHSGKEVEVEGAQPWLSSSTLWSFVESIPAAPASAAESALVNKAFQRLSSFSRVRGLNAKITTTTTPGCVSTGGSSSISARAGGLGSRIKGLFRLSIFAVLFAILCMFFVSNVGKFGKLTGNLNV